MSLKIYSRKLTHEVIFAFLNEKNPEWKNICMKLHKEKDIV